MQIKEEDLNVKELKKVAKSMGYYLKPITPEPKLELCLCGFNTRKRENLLGGRMVYICNKCGFMGHSGVGIKQAKLGWNEAIRLAKERKEEDNEQ